MPRKLSQNVKNHLVKCQTCAVYAVGAYNHPGSQFRTALYVILIVMAWTALFHALFFQENQKPWRRKKGTKAIRYEKIDGEPKYWGLAECLEQYYKNQKDKNPAERVNLKFLIGLRNIIEHRHLPTLDPSVFGECQAALHNLEAMLDSNFGGRYSLANQLEFSLQFSKITPAEKQKAQRALATRMGKEVKEYVEKFRDGLTSTILYSKRYAIQVYLTSKAVNRESLADFSAKLIHADEPSPEELDKMSAIIREKKVHDPNLYSYLPGQVVNKLRKASPFQVTMRDHTAAWQHFAVRPLQSDEHRNRTNLDFCAFDAAHGDYLYTEAWVTKLAREFSNAASFRTVTGKEPEKQDTS
ncbi:MAG: hypothetical protein A6F71_10050 [Cycloclasticus sp. symbiont of Poecilosclerida sp. M]|nr:MAG: hypothetical protein A6F71_10050 [Cycloclasticus sp. symbiont of Poecilosclerida sp. M]